jgi:hypothetical protein
VHRLATLGQLRWLYVDKAIVGFRRNLAISVHRDQGAEIHAIAPVRHRQFNNRQRTLAPSPCFRQTKPPLFDFGAPVLLPSMQGRLLGR